MSSRRDKKNSLDGIVVLSYYDKCPCGEIITYGHRYCKSHDRIREPYKDRKCFVCGSTNTYAYQNTKKQWRHDDKHNLLCKRCYDKQWRAENYNYAKVWRYANYEYVLIYQRQWRYYHPHYYEASERLYRKARRENEQRYTTDPEYAAMYDERERQRFGFGPDWKYSNRWRI